jgi:CheY-like chemotaxis protein
MPVILVLDDDARTRAALAAELGRLFPRVSVLAADTEAAIEPIADERIVLTSLAVAERIGRRPRPSAVRVVALTPEMGPATLMKAEAAGVYATLRAPATAEGLRAVLGPIVGDATSSKAEG